MSGVGKPTPRLLLYTEDADADFMKANEHYQSIDIADDSFRALTHCLRSGLQEATRLRNGHSGEDAAGY